MKSILIGCTILALLTWATLSSPVGSYDPCSMVIWAEWIRLPRRRRPYYNPLRRYRLTKKQRQRLRRRLGRLLEPQRRLAPGQESTIELGAVLLDSERCS